MGTPDCRANLSSSSQLADAAYARATWSRVKPRLDAYARDWVAMRGEACTAHLEGRQSSTLYDLRTACLDQRHAGLSALVDGLSGVAAETVDYAEFEEIRERHEGLRRVAIGVYVAGGVLALSGLIILLADPAGEPSPKPGSTLSIGPGWVRGSF